MQFSHAHLVVEKRYQPMAYKPKLQLETMYGKNNVINMPTLVYKMLI
jgi:hypothetical protein